MGPGGGKPARQGHAGGWARGAGRGARRRLPSSSSSEVMDLERRVRAVVGARLGGGGAGGGQERPRRESHPGGEAATPPAFRTHQEVAARPRSPSEISEATPRPSVGGGGGWGGEGAAALLALGFTWASMGWGQASPAPLHSPQQPGHSGPCPPVGVGPAAWLGWEVLCPPVTKGAWRLPSLCTWLPPPATGKARQAGGSPRPSAGTGLRGAHAPSQPPFEESLGGGPLAPPSSSPHPCRHRLQAALPAVRQFPQPRLSVGWWEVQGCGQDQVSPAPSQPGTWGSPCRLPRERGGPESRGAASSANSGPRGQ